MSIHHPCIRDLIRCGLLLGGLAAGTAAHASAAASSHSVQIAYSPAALSQPAEARRLYRRIQAAARNVCGTPDARELARYFRARDCSARAVDAAVTAINATELTAIHRERAQRLVTS